jgi:hypothetical protein
MLKMVMKAEIAQAELSLKQLGIEVGGPGVGKKILRALATAGKKWVKRRMGNYLHLNRTMQSSDFAVQRGLKEAVYGFARSDTSAVVASGMGYIAEPLERGAVIRASKKKFISFRGDDGNWHRAKQITLPAKRWFTQSIAGFEGSSEYMPTVEKVIGKAIKKAGMSK